MEGLVQNSSNVTLLGFVCTVCAAILTWCLKRQNALFPLLIMTCYMPLGQMFVIAGLHLHLFRILLLIGVVRVLVNKENENLEFTPLDKIFLWWVIFSLVIGTLTKPSMERFINRSGETYNAVGAYFLFRCWIRNMGDLVSTVRFLALMVVPLALSMVVEKFTSRNVFSIFGGVPEITVEREGRLRCQGAFRHPILAGTYAATLFPLFVGMLFGQRRDRVLALMGIIASGVATVAAASSGALLAMLAGAFGFALWRMRLQMHLLRRLCLGAIVALAMVMKAPVWYLIARVSDITGGTGWHRSYLIDQAIEHFGEWWLLGTAYTAHWAPSGQVLTVDPDNMDITNHYIAEGVNGGLLKLGLFLAMIVLCFMSVGHWIRQPEASELPRCMLVWSLGVCAAAHCVSFLSISYFDQIVVMWYWVLAIFSLLTCRKATIWEGSA